MYRALRIFVVLLLFLAATGAPAAGNQGFLHGTVTLKDGDSHTGFLRWGDEEAYWDDHFHGRRLEYPYFDQVDMEEIRRQRRQRYFNNNGLFNRLAYALTSDREEIRPRRILICRFGDLAELTPTDDHEATVLTRDGRTHLVAGYSNDVGQDVTVTAPGTEPLELDWDDIALVTFSPAPAATDPDCQRLYGTVFTDQGDFTGYIQWDASERTTLDELDGDDEEGADREIPMGEIATLETVDSRSTRVGLKDGTTLVLHGTNDVNDDNRGILIELTGEGRVEVAWKHFRRLEFRDPPDSGPSYDAYAACAPLPGSVRDTDGAEHRGHVIFNLECDFGGDMLTGQADGLQWSLPFANLQSVTREDEDAAAVALASGRQLLLKNENDLGPSNLGMMVLPPSGDGEPDYLSWDCVTVFHIGD